MSAMAHEHKQISRIVKVYLLTPAELEPEVQQRGRDWRCNMTCPKCQSENEMLFSALSLSFICDEPACGLELEVDERAAEVLLEPERDLTFA
jgi:hypothetical protein